MLVWVVLPQFFQVHELPAHGMRISRDWGSDFARSSDRLTATPFDLRQSGNPSSCHPPVSGVPDVGRSSDSMQILWMSLLRTRVLHAISKWLGVIYGFESRVKVARSAK